MEPVQMILDYFKENPNHGALLAVGLVILYFALNRRSRLTQQADRRIEELREERGEYYRNVRPPR
jgi:hypothetical protein